MVCITAFAQERVEVRHLTPAYTSVHNYVYTYLGPVTPTRNYTFRWDLTTAGQNQVGNPEIGYYKITSSCRLNCTGVIVNCNARVNGISTSNAPKMQLVLHFYNGKLFKYSVEITHRLGAWPLELYSPGYLDYIYGPDPLNPPTHDFGINLSDLLNNNVSNVELPLKYQSSYWDCYWWNTSIIRITPANLSEPDTFIGLGTSSYRASELTSGSLRINSFTNRTPLFDQETNAWYRFGLSATFSSTEPLDKSDVNKDGHKSVEDIFTFLEYYFTFNGDYRNRRIDINRDNYITVEDLYAFLNDYIN
jgi:hypothetical protein